MGDFIYPMPQNYILRIDVIYEDNKGNIHKGYIIKNANFCNDDNAYNSFNYYNDSVLTDSNLVSYRKRFRNQTINHWNVQKVGDLFIDMRAQTYFAFFCPNYIVVNPDIYNGSNRFSKKALSRPALKYQVQVSAVSFDFSIRNRKQQVIAACKGNNEDLKFKTNVLYKFGNHNFFE